MKNAMKSKAPLFRTPVRTLTPKEMAMVSGGIYEAIETGKPSPTPIDVQGFR